MRRSEYNRIVARIEKADMYDGRNRGVDVYLCNTCGRCIYTRYKDKGVTPFTMQCRTAGCPGTMTHRTTVSEEFMASKDIKVLNWVRPSWEQLEKMRRDFIDGNMNMNYKGVEKHLENGGLMLEDEIS